MTSAVVSCQSLLPSVQVTKDGSVVTAPELRAKPDEMPPCSHSGMATTVFPVLGAGVTVEGTLETGLLFLFL